MNQSSKPQSFASQETRCETTFNHGGPYWHLCTPGQFTEIIFEKTDDYKFIMNAVAIIAATLNIHILTFEIMSNHVHFILECEADLGLVFFEMLKRRLQRYLTRSGRFVNLADFKVDPIPIDNLDTLRIEIVYVNRNGYLVHPEHTPFSYPWGSGYLFFNQCLPVDAMTPYSKLSDLKKRQVCKGRALALPDNYLVYGDIISPLCFCSIEKGKALFRDAHHYFSLISKSFEAYSAVAKRLGDSVFLTDDEMSSTLRIISKKMYGDVKPAMLGINDKLALARKMRSEYNASEGQIQRMLRLDRKVVSELFGKSSK